MVDSVLNTNIHYPLPITDFESTESVNNPRAVPVSVNALQTLAANAETGNSLNDGSPQTTVELQPPVADASKDSLFFIFATITQMLKDAGNANMKATLELQNQQASIRVLTVTDALANVNTAKSNLANSQQDLAAATRQLQSAQQLLAEKSNTVDKAQANLDKANLRLAQIEQALKEFPDDLATRQKYLEAQDSVTAGQQLLESAQSEQNQAQQSCELAIAAANNAADSALIAQEQLVQATDDYVAAAEPGADPLPDTDEIKNEMQFLLTLMATLSDLLNKTELAKLHNANALNSELQDTRVKRAKEMAAAYQDEVDAAREKNERASRVSKWINGALLGIGLLSAIFTGPLGLALALTSIGIFTADCVKEKRGKETVTSKMMAPVMEHIIKPFQEALTNYIVEQSNKPGHHPIDRDKAEMIAMCVSITVVMVAGMVGMGAVSAAVNRVMPKFITQGLISTGTAGAVIKALGCVTQLTGSATQTAISVREAKDIKQAQNIQGDLTEVNAEIDVLQKTMKTMVDHFCNNNIAYALQNNTSDLIDELNKYAGPITRNIRA